MTAEAARILWVGEVEPWMDETFIFHHMFGGNPDLINVKLIKEKNSGHNAGYGFVTFRTNEAAARILQDYNGKPIANTTKRYRLNWGSHGSPDTKPDTTPEFTLFVGDLSADVTEATLFNAFQVHYPSIRGAKIITDPNNGTPKGYGFVRFGDEGEQQRAMVEMQGVVIGSRPVRISNAKKSSQATSSLPPPPPVSGAVSGTVDYRSADYDPALDVLNSTLFVGNLDPSMNEQSVRTLFAPYGELVYCRVPPGKGCGFVQYMYRPHAEQAMEQLNGFTCGANRLRVAWGRSSTRSPVYANVVPSQTSAPPTHSMDGAGAYSQPLYAYPGPYGHPHYNPYAQHWPAHWAHAAAMTAVPPHQLPPNAAPPPHGPPHAQNLVGNNNNGGNQGGVGGVAAGNRGEENEGGDGAGGKNGRGNFGFVNNRGGLYSAGIVRGK